MTERSGTIALVHFSRAAVKFFPREIGPTDAFLGALEYLRDRAEWRIATLGLPLAPAQTLRRIADIRRKNISGVLVCGEQEVVVARCAKERIPVVAMNRFTTEIEVPTVRHDDEAIGRVAAVHFLRRGIRSLAFMGPDYLSIRDEPTHLNMGRLRPWVSLRLKGFASEAAASQVPCSVFYNPDKAAPTSEPDKVCAQRYQRDLHEWIRRLPRPVGILGCADTWAMDCLTACEQEGLHVPQDVAVLGVDNNVLRCDASRPSLSSVDRNMRQIGREAAAMLIRFLETGVWEKSPILVRPAGVSERRSTQSLAVSDPKLAKALQFVQEHFHEPISVHNVARAANASQSWLRREFQRQLRFSLVGEVRRLRVERACDLLANTDLSLKTIAEVVGLRTDTYLCHVFAQDLGVSPGAWRLSRHRPPSRLPAAKEPADAFDADLELA